MSLSVSVFNSSPDLVSHHWSPTSFSSTSPLYLSFPVPLPSPVSPCLQGKSGKADGQDRRASLQPFLHPCSELGLLLELGVGVGVSREAAGDQWREGTRQSSDESPSPGWRVAEKGLVGPHRKLCIQKTQQDIAPPPVLGLPEKS